MMGLAGVAAAPDRFVTENGVVDARVAAVITSENAVVLGRRTNDEWAPYWPTSNKEPFAGIINPVMKNVATSQSLDPGWANASAFQGDLLERVQALEQDEGGDIGVHGSIAAAQAFLATGLVDEIRLSIMPGTAGAGRLLLDGIPATLLG